MTTDEPVAARTECADAPGITRNSRANRAGSMALAIAAVAAALCVGVLVASDRGISMLSARLRESCPPEKTPTRGELEKVEQEFRADFARAAPVTYTLMDFGALLLVMLVFAGTITGIIGLVREGLEKRKALTALLIMALIVGAYYGYGWVRRAQMQRELPNLPAWYWSK
jgi:hypothetical protein